MAHPDSATDPRTTTEPCRTCRGTGTVTAGEQRAAGPGGARTTSRDESCPACEGTGGRTGRHTVPKPDRR